MLFSAKVLQTYICCSLALSSMGLSRAEEEMVEISDGIPSFILEEDEDRSHGEVPALFRDDALLDDSHANQELGVNVYTAPSISKIFAQLEGLPPIPDDRVLRSRPEQLPTIVGKLAMELGFLLADGFIAVRSGRMNDIKPIALDLSRYGKALGVGDKMNTHSASLLEQAEKGLLRQFKETLAATQVDVNSELSSLRDPDLSHLIALGGWIRALTASASALDAEFDAKKAAILFYPDAPEYFAEILSGINPDTASKIESAKMIELLTQLTQKMTPKKQDAVPTHQEVKDILLLAEQLSTLAVGEGYKY